MFVGLKKLLFESVCGEYSGESGGLMFGERQETNEFFREPEFFLDALLLLDMHGEREFDGLKEEADRTLCSSSPGRTIVGDVDLLRNGLSSGNCRHICLSSAPGLQTSTL